jgi:hypothetical protein
MSQVIAESTGRRWVPVDDAVARHVAEQMQGERVQSELFFEALRRSCP